MRIRSSRWITILSAMAMLSACSRPPAYFQPTARGPVASQLTAKVTQRELPTPASTEELPVLVERTASSAAPVNQAKLLISQVEAYVSTDTKLNLNRKLAKRLVRINQVLDATTKPSLAPAQLTARKTTHVERTWLKKIDKKVRQHLAPNQPKALSSTILLGVVIALVGLLLVIIASGFLNTLGIIALVVGVGLIVYTYLTK